MSTNPTHLEQQNQTEQQNKAPVSSIRTHSGFTLWLDGLRCKLTVHAWRRRTKKARRHHSFRQVLARVPHANLIGDALYMIGFWVEYAVVCAVRGTYKVASTIGMNAARLLVTIIRPFALGIITLCEDIVEPFQVVGSGIRHFRAISDELSDESAHTIRKEKLRYFAHAARQFLPLLLNALSYIMPVAAAAGFLLGVGRVLTGFFFMAAALLLTSLVMRAFPALRQSAAKKQPLVPYFAVAFIPAYFL